tara:strand:+ start:335 stop:568 length:234 start_codon:yes stop_codon:yes gene_type:complete
MQIQHSRKDYNFIDLLGDIGGLSFIFTTLVSFFFLALSEFGLILNAFNTMFKLKDEDAKFLFDHDSIDHSKAKILRK